MTGGLPSQLWEQLEDSLDNLDLRLSPEIAKARIQRMLLLQEDGRESEHLFVSIAALALAGAMACRLQREAREPAKTTTQPDQPLLPELGDAPEAPR